MTLQTLDRAAVGLPITRSGTSFMPIYLPDNPLPRIATGPDSGLVIDELGSGSVPVLQVRNPGDTPILIVEGEHFVGGKQNRALNATVLVPAGASQEVPVSCLERGRWGAKRAYSRSASFAPRHVRRRKSAGVHASMVSSGSRRGNQGAVWSAVDEVLAGNRVASATASADALHDKYRRDRSWAATVDQLVRLGPLPGQCGFAVSHGQWTVAIELFGSRELFAAHWPALVRSYMMDRPGRPGLPSTTRVLLMLRRFGQFESHDSPGVGLGAERRVSTPAMIGQSLALNGSIVHASIFTRRPRKKAPPHTTVPPHRKVPPGFGGPVT